MGHAHGSLEWIRENCKETESGCWEWAKSRSSEGYGHLKHGGKLVSTHRLVMLLTGHELKKGDCVLHRCDNPPCCCPLHLWIGTKADNAQDREAKGRRRALKGEDNVLSKFNEHQVRLVKRLHECEGFRQSEISRLLGLSTGVINYIVRGIYWKHVQI